MKVLAYSPVLPEGAPFYRILQRDGTGWRGYWLRRGIYERASEADVGAWVNEFKEQA